MAQSQIFASSVKFFLSPIEDYLNDEDVTEVMINRFDEIYVEKHGQLHRTDAVFENEDALLSAIYNVAQYVGRRINEENPILDARMPDGSRVNAVLPPGARRGVCMTIRKFRTGGLTLADLISFGSISESAREFLELCVRLHKNTLLSGGTGTGKTSLLGAVSAAVPNDERVIVIEDTAELQLPQEHVVYLEVQKPDEYGRGGLEIRDLFRSSLRMRPDRIIVGEVRGGEALDMVQSMISGHAGSLTTVHANSARDSLIRLETLSMMSDVAIPVYVARAQVGAAIHLVVQLSRFSEDGSRRIVQISEVRGLDKDDQYNIVDLYKIKLGGKTEDGKLNVELVPTGEKPTFADEARGFGLDRFINHSAPLWT